MSAFPSKLMEGLSVSESVTRRFFAARYIVNPQFIARIDLVIASREVHHAQVRHPFSPSGDQMGLVTQEFFVAGGDDLRVLRAFARQRDLRAAHSRVFGAHARDIFAVRGRLIERLQ